MDAPLPPPIVAVAKSADCLCKPDCKCDPCKCVAAKKANGATVSKTADGYKVVLPDGRVHLFRGDDWTEKGMIAFAETYNAMPGPVNLGGMFAAPGFYPGNCPGGVCPVPR